MLDAMSAKSARVAKGGSVGGKKNTEFLELIGASQRTTYM